MYIFFAFKSKNKIKKRNKCNKIIISKFVYNIVII